MKTTALAALAFLLLSLPVFAQKSEIFSTDLGAIQGYDPVAYFTEGKPVKGSPQLTYTWKGANWHFASQKNLDSFKADPQKFAPQYGGYCAYGMAGGYKAPTEPGAWTITNGKLYLNYNGEVQDSWNKDQAEQIKKADANWPTVAGQDK